VDTRGHSVPSSSLSLDSVLFLFFKSEVSKNKYHCSRRSKRRFILKVNMPSTDCAVLHADIPGLDELNCCDHPAINCLEKEGELRVVYIDDTTGQLIGYSSFD
jgi:hypothetical protein